MKKLVLGLGLVAVMFSCSTDDCGCKAYTWSSRTPDEITETQLNYDRIHCPYGEREVTAVYDWGEAGLPLHYTITTVVLWN